jgi:hypothetical protein
VGDFYTQIPISLHDSIKHNFVWDFDLCNPLAALGKQVTITSYFIDKKFDKTECVSETSG